MLTPETEAEMAEAVAAASEPLSIRGGGTRGMAGAGMPLSTAGLSGIMLYEPGALTLVARAGTPLAEIEAALAAEAQMLAFEPMDHRPLLGTEGEPTIGGVVAANVSGPRRVAPSGACRDSLLGLRFVDGSGTVVKNGGRVMKNVTGYDLARLMCGARGTLGVLTEVSLKVLPRPDAVATVTLPDLDPARAVAAMSAALTTPFQVSGAAWCDGAVHLRLEGLERSVSYRAGELARALEAFGTARTETDRDACRALWAELRDVSSLAACAYVGRTSLKPSDVSALLEAAGEAEVCLDWGGGLVWSGAADAEAGEPLHRRLQDASARLGGHTTLVKGPPELRAAVPALQPETPPVAALSRGLKAKFDPRSILNTGS